MTRQLEQKQEQRDTARRDALVRTLEFGLVGALEGQGMTFLGFNMKYQDFSCLLTLKAIVEDTHSVSFVGSDTMVNCLLKAELEARHHRLRWKADKYQPHQT